jgi:nitronate monooxygenase
MSFPHLMHPIVQAPLSGGPSTPELAAAVSGAGGLGFLAAGYTTASDLDVAIGATHNLTAAPFGVNLFVLEESVIDEAALNGYRQALAGDAERLGATLGATRFDDDDLAAKITVLEQAHVAVVSTAFGCPSAEVTDRLHAAGSSVWVTIGSPAEVESAVAVAADALVVQGTEAGGHRGGLDDESELTLIPLLRLVARETDLPLVAAGGIGDGPSVAAVLAAGAAAAQVGTAFLRTPEAGTNPAHRAALAGSGATAITRAFTGRLARGIVNEFMLAHPDAPAAYPQIHQLTAPLRTAARAVGNTQAINLWAGQAYPLAEELPAADLVRKLAADARAALAAASKRAGID